jgi:branched-chain amino acid transport system substrate-binding protein
MSNLVRDAIHDVSIIAAVTDFDAQTGRITVPLFNEAGILQVSPGTTYAGFVASVGDSDPDAPGRYFPSGHRTFAPLLPTTAAAAVALARAATGKVAIEEEGGEAGSALAEAIRQRVGTTVDTADADTVIYAGEDAESARGVVESVLRENRRASVLLPAELADVAGQLGRRVAAVTAAGPPADTGFDAAYRQAFGGDRPGPYAQLGYRAMRGVLAAIDRAGKKAVRRQAVVDAYFATDPLRTAAEQPFFLRTRGGYSPLD